MGIGAVAALPSADPGERGSPAGRRRHAVRGSGGFRRRRAANHRAGGARTKPGEPQRHSGLELRHGAVEIRRPDGEWDRQLPPTVRLRPIEVAEIAAPADAEPLHWRLLTTHDVGDADAAWQIVDWYQRRWVVAQGNSYRCPGGRTVSRRAMPARAVAAPESAPKTLANGRELPVRLYYARAGPHGE